MLLALPSGSCDVCDPYRTEARRTCSISDGRRRILDRTVSSSSCEKRSESSSCRSTTKLQEWSAPGTASGNPHMFSTTPETGDRFKDLWLGLKKACRKAGLKGVTWHTFRHMFRLTTYARRSGPGDRERTTGTCEHNNNDASRAYKPRGQKTSCVATARTGEGICVVTVAVNPGKLVN